MEATTMTNQDNSEVLRRLKHDLRNPVNHILGYSDLLLEEPECLDAVQANTIRSIRDCGEELLRQIEKILADGTKGSVLELRRAFGPVVLKLCGLSNPADSDFGANQDMVLNIHRAGATLLAFVERGTLPAHANASSGH